MLHSVSVVKRRVRLTTHKKPFIVMLIIMLIAIFSVKCDQD